MILSIQIVIITILSYIIAKMVDSIKKKTVNINKAYVYIKNHIII